MFDFTNCDIELISVHHVGNKTNEEELVASTSLLDISDELLKGTLLRFFTQPFANTELYNFTSSNGDLAENPIYNYTKQLFESQKDFHKLSINIAEHLFEISTHPQIKSGDLFVVYFTNVQFEDEETNVLGIFKSENRQQFLKLDSARENFKVQCHDGINVDKLDKGCLIFNLDKVDGYKVSIVDKSNRLTEAQYWKETFLQLKPCSDDYHHTKDFLNITKNFITKQLPNDFEVDKAEQINYLNRSVDYFKTHDAFDKNEFESEVFNHQNVIDSFRTYDTSFREENNINPASQFEISPDAVKKQSKALKSVLKLDRNFHIYIHGDKELIERGVDDNGRKYYKIYYNNEA
jgi:hypothetical protein